MRVKYAGLEQLTVRLHMNKSPLSEPSRSQYKRTIDRAAALHRRKQWKESLPFWQAARALTDSLPGPWLGEGQALANLGQTEKARDVFAEAATRWPDHFGLTVGLARAEETLDRPEEAKRHWAIVAEKWPDRHEGPLGLIRNTLGSDSDDRLLALAKDALYRWPDVREAVNLAAEAAQATLSSDEILTFWHAVHTTYPRNAAISLAYSEALYFLDSPDKAISTAITALKNAAAQSNLVLSRQLAIRTTNWLTRAGRLDEALDATNVGLENQETDQQLLLLKGEILAAQGYREQAEATFREIVRLSPDNLHAYLGLAALVASDDASPGLDVPSQPASRLAELISPTIDLKRPVFQGDVTEIQESPAGHSGTLVVLLGGAYRKSLGIPIELMDRYFASRDISALYVRDGALRTLTEGSDGLLPTEALDALVRRTQERLGSKKLYLVGVSAGGFEAIRLGLLGNPDGIIGISAPTNLTQSFVDSVKDNRAKLLIKRFNRLYNDYQLDMAIPLKDHPNPPPIHLIYPVENYGDRVQAEYLSDQPNVTLHPISGWEGHNVHEKLIASGDLFTFFDKLVLTSQ